MNEPKITKSIYCNGSGGCYTVWQMPDGKYQAGWEHDPAQPNGYQVCEFDTEEQALAWCDQWC